MTTNAGALWETKYRGAAMRDGNEICVAPDGSVWGATDSTIFWSTNNGADWNTAHAADFTMDVDSPDGTNVWAVRQNYDGGIIYFSPDAGATWTQQVSGGVRGLQTVTMQKRTKTYPAGTRFVWTNSPSPGAPFTNWATAAHTIQEAIDAAENGDGIVVADGFYSIATQLTITQRLELASVNGPGSTIVHAESNRCLYITAPATVAGITFTNGYVGAAPYHGAGIYANATGVVIRNCRFEQNQNRMRGQGGGLWLGASGVVENCVFNRNQAGDGGGVFVREWSSVSDCRFQGNEARTNGGGVFANYTNTVVSNCVFVGNAASDYGGGISARGFIIGCTAVSNISGYYGGGIYIPTSGRIVDRCVLTDNISSNSGGGIYALKTTIRNTLILRNTAQDQGGGARLGDSLLESCTVVSNTAPKGGGFYSSFSTALNSIVYFNTPQNYSNRNTSSVWNFCCASPSPSGAQNFDENPRFLFESAANYRLATNSPCLGAGTNQTWMAGGTDLDGALRVSGDSVDMGAYELGALIVDFEATPAFGVAPLDAAFSAVASGTNSASVWFRWDFTNDGSFDEEGLWLTAVTNQYPGGTYSVLLSVSNAAGETASMVKTSYIVAQGSVTADFTAAPRTGAAPLVVQFADASTNNPQYWAWDFENDGLVDSTEQNPLHTYTSTGLFTVALTVSNDFGGGNTSSDTMIKTNFISAPVYHLVADFSVSTTNALTYEDIEFTDLSQHNPTHWTWYFRNVGTGDSFEQNPTSYYTSTGYKTVKLEISNEWSSAVVVKTNLITVTGHTLTHYVAPGGGNQAPFTNWATAAHSISAAIDAADVLDTIIVSNGVYGVPFLGLLCNGLVITSVNGAAVTVITGGGSEHIIRAAAFRNEPTIIDGFTLTNAYSSGDGAGAWITRNVLLRNCVITGCRADENGGGVMLSGGGLVGNCDIIGNSAGGSGGGIYMRDGGTVTHSRVWGNVSGDGGGGIHAYSTNARNEMLISHCVISSNIGCGVYLYHGTIRNSLITTNRAFMGGGLNLSYSDAENCTVFGNDATHGGGIYMASVSTARNCIVWGNTRSNLFRNAGVVFEYGDVEPATTGTGNVADDPRFMDSASGDFRLKYGSPAIDSGTADSAPADDLDGMTRPLDGNYDGATTRDMGCHEYDPAIADSNQDGVPDWWYHGYLLNPTSLTVAAEDADEDSFNNKAEWIALTNPTDSNSYFFVADIRQTNSISVVFNGSPQRVYSLQSSTNLSDDSWLMVAGATNRPGTGPATMLVDTNNAIIKAYRVEVSLP